VLTLVEVKRATDTRARREVVAQILDCAASAVLYWPVAHIVNAYERTARGAGRDPDRVLAEFLSGGDGGGAAAAGQAASATTHPPGVEQTRHDEEADAAAFWEGSRLPLAAERIRMYSSPTRSRGNSSG